jgi:hypothetical protein
MLFEEGVRSWKEKFNILCAYKYKEQYQFVDNKLCCRVAKNAIPKGLINVVTKIFSLATSDTQVSSAETFVEATIVNSTLQKKLTLESVAILLI